MHDLETGETAPTPGDTHSSNALPRRESDRKLVAATSQGDESATDAFAARMRCVPRFLAVLNRRTGRVLDEHEIDDVAQSTIATLWRRRGSFEGSGSPASGGGTFCVFSL